MSENDLIARELEEYIRVGSRSELALEDKTVYTKRVNLPINRVEKMYNSKGDLICVDIIKQEFNDKEVIQNAKTGKTIVIIHNEGKKYKGVSMCHEDDYYDSQTGYKLALLRANKKMYEDRLKEYEKKLNEDTESKTYKMFVRNWEGIFN